MRQRCRHTVFSEMAQRAGRANYLAARSLMMHIKHYMKTKPK
jgi:hypothetical protein